MPRQREPKIDTELSLPWRNIFVLFGRGVVYSLAFCLVYFMTFRLPYYVQTSTDSYTALRQRQSEQSDTYDQQAKKFEESLLETERQQARLAAVISKQEDHAKRMDAVIERWERQSGVKK